MLSGANRGLIVLVGIFLMSVAVNAQSSSVWTVVPSPKEENWVWLPKLAQVLEEDKSGQTWRQNGEIPVAFGIAKKDFETSFKKQGWIIEKLIPTGNREIKNEIYVWSKGERRMILMLTELEPNKSAFALGEE